MGQKVNPVSFRLQVNKDWQSKWFAAKNYGSLLNEDLKIRKALERRFGHRAGVARVDIERMAGKVNVILHTSKPGVIIGRGGAGAEEIKKILSKITPSGLNITIEEVKNPERNAKLLADNVVSQLERRVAFRRAIRGSLEQAMRAGAQGVKITVAGRLNGAEMARRETSTAGKVPLHTLRADIDFAQSVAKTTYGVIGVKVWIYNGEVFAKKEDKK